MSIVDLSTKRQKVYYTVRIEQGWDGTLTVFVEDVADDPRSRKAVADALLDAAIGLGAKLPNAELPGRVPARSG